MGGVSAKQDGVVFEAREEYMRWSLSDVKSAVLRWHAVSKRGSLHISAGGVFQKFGVNRREFWEIFTDYAVLRDGAFLCLPVRAPLLLAAVSPRLCAQLNPCRVTWWLLGGVLRCV